MTFQLVKPALVPARGLDMIKPVESLTQAVHLLSRTVGDPMQSAVRLGELVEAGLLSTTAEGALVGGSGFVKRTGDVMTGPLTIRAPIWNTFKLENDNGPLNAKRSYIQIRGDNGWMDLGHVTDDGGTIQCVATLTRDGRFLVPNTLALGGGSAYKITNPGFVYFPSVSPHLAYYKKASAGAYHFYWRRTDDGEVGGPNETTLMELRDHGALYVFGTINSTGGSAALFSTDRTNGRSWGFYGQGDRLIVYNGSSNIGGWDPNGLFFPWVDAAVSLGGGGNRWSVVYAATGAINTSDAREKTPVSPFTPDELAAAKLLAKEIGMYQWLAMIAEKGADEARRHCGLTVQRAIEVMESCDLDPMRYGFICYDEWEETPESEDALGNVVPATPAGDRYSFRMDELMMFIARGFEARLSALEEA